MNTLCLINTSKHFSQDILPKTDERELITTKLMITKIEYNPIIHQQLRGKRNCVILTQCTTI